MKNELLQQGKITIVDVEYKSTSRGIFERVLGHREARRVSAAIEQRE